MGIDFYDTTKGMYATENPNLVRVELRGIPAPSIYISGSPLLNTLLMPDTTVISMLCLYDLPSLVTFELSYHIHIFGCDVTMATQLVLTRVFNLTTVIMPQLAS